MNIHLKPLLILMITLNLVAGSLLSGCAPKEEEHETTTTTKIHTTATDKPPASIGTEISIVGTKAPFFDPAEVTIEVGGRITWTHTDKTKRPHTITAEDKSFDSDKLNKGDIFSRNFEKAGEYPYHCTIHPTMIGKIIVKEKS